MTDKKDAAVATLEHLGYTHEGGSLWKPPLGKAPDFNMLDSLRARAASLEDQLIAQANRAVIAEQEVIALTRRLDMANRLNTDAREQLAQLSARQAAPDGWRQSAQAVIDRWDSPLWRQEVGTNVLINDLRAMLSAAPPPPEREPKCGCETCRPITLSDMRFIVCPDCGNKRCPKANHHDNACTNSNAPGQPGSSWEHVKPHGATNDNP